MLDDLRKKLILEAFENSSYVNLIGMEMVDLKYGQATIKLKMRNDLKRTHGILHGGATASLIDTATGFAAESVLKNKEKAVTIDLTISYLRPVTEGFVTCTAKVIKTGRRIMTLTAEAENEDGKLIATALTTYMKV